MIKYIDHIGIAVKSIERTLPFYRDILQLTFLGLEEVPTQHVKVAFFSSGETKLELLEPIDNQGEIAKFLHKRGEGIHHIAFQVPNIHQSLSDLLEKGIRLIDNSPRLGANQSLVAFIHPLASSHVLIELCEKRGEWDVG